MNIEKTERPLTLRACLAYGAGDLYGGGIFFLVTTFSMYYLVNVVGLHPFLAGLVPAIGNIWDAISDPLMGYISDNTPDNRFGKRRVWFLVSIVPIAVSFILIWFPVSIASEMGRFTFYLCAYLFFFTSATVAYIPYAALSAEMTHNFAERNKLNTFRMMFSFVSTLVAGLGAQPIIDSYHGSKYGYFVMGIIFALFFALPWIPLYLGTWELPSLPQPKQRNHSFILNFLSLFRNKSCRLHIAMYVCAYGALDIFMSLVLFYLVDYLNKPSFFVIAQGTLLLTMMICLPIYNKIATKRGHGTAYRIGLSLFASGLVVMLFLTPHTSNIPLVIAIFLMGAGIAGGNLVPHQLLPFISDIDKLISGKSRAGTYSAAMSLTRKLFLGVIVMTIIGAILSGIGYKNPVPSILPDSQFQEGIALCKQKGIQPDLWYRYYAQYADGNWYLRYESQAIEAIIQSLYKKRYGHSDSKQAFPEGSALDSIPADTFENGLLGSLTLTDPQDGIKAFLLHTMYEKQGTSYKRLTNPQLVSKDELYDLKVFLDTISFTYPGLGTVQKPQQKERTLKGIRLFFILLPLIMLCSGIITALHFKVTPETHAIILAEIERLEHGGRKADVSPDTKRICELLTGMPYEKIWPSASS